MPAGVAYVTVQQFCAFHNCETVLVEELLDYDIVAVQRRNNIVVIPEPEVPRLERALRLHVDLGVNAPGVDIILTLLDRLDRAEGRHFTAIEDVE